MSDTLKEAELYLNNLYRKFSGEEKISMASKMFDNAREIILSSLPEGLSEKEKKIEFFLRFYKDDFNEKTRSEIIKRF